MDVAVLLLLLQVTAEKETVSIPDTKVSFDLVRISGAPGLRPFSIGAREVTWGEFNGYHHDRTKGADAVTRPSNALAYFGDMGIPQEFLDPRRPVVLPRWHSAMGYCEWLSRRTGRYFRLPTEKEWEAAARGNAEDGSWHKGNSEKRTHVVGEKNPNSSGLYDMLGNVWEYCLETGSPETFSPVLRGGSWTVPAAEVTIAARRTISEAWFDYDVHRPRSVWWLASSSAEQGFRVVCVPDAADPKDRANFVVRILKKVDVDVQTGKAKDAFCKVSGNVRNDTDRTVEELELQVYFLTPAGAPHLVDLEAPKPSHPTFSKCWPVLKNGSDEKAAVPLKPGETRNFEVFVPQTYDAVPEVDPEKVGGRVTNLRFAKE